MANLLSTLRKQFSFLKIGYDINIPIQMKHLSGATMRGLALQFLQRLQPINFT